jgi:GntR family histidine utilization transcriptional repressor
MEKSPTSAKSSASLQPLYLKVKRHILDNIGSGKWPASARVPSENDIVKSFGVSRMTANRALRELRDEGVLVRIAGVGSFVAERHARAHPLEIRSIADEIRERGHAHRAEIVSLERVRAVAELAADFGIAPRSELYCSELIHFENDRPVQLEDRYVLPKLAPDYLQIDFSRLTPFDYLTAVAPLQEAEHLLRAVMPDERTRKLLDMKPGEPCLLVIRRTWSAAEVASVARLYYPGSRYEMSGRFRPGPGGEASGARTARQVP